MGGKEAKADNMLKNGVQKVFSGIVLAKAAGRWVIYSKSSRRSLLLVAAIS